MSWGSLVHVVGNNYYVVDDMYPRYLSICTHDMLDATHDIKNVPHDINHVPHDINQTIVNSRMQRFTYNFSASYVVGNIIDVVGHISWIHTVGIIDLCRGDH